ncbi:vitamin K epoxide reductase family protein [Pedobacter gandavensis]|uniref:vitamin K epoxide reductase family protein n=1 Tax=Pedobacter gandavensis TaxID=2679963 RepID=UPI0029317BB8|nr:vitamin K epoxide reductase family protein [Pedobacter gandavensis]
MKSSNQKSILLNAFLSIIKKNQTDNLVSTAKFITDHFQIKTTKTSLLSHIEHHIDYPSLLTIKDTLLEFGIESAAIKKGNYSYADFDTPFVCAIQQEDWGQASFTVVIEANNEEIQYLDPLTNSVTTIPTHEFENLDKEIMLLLDGDQKKDEPSYNENKKKESIKDFIKQIPFYFILFSFLLTGFQLYTSSENYTWTNLVFLSTSFIGFGISLLLLLHDIDSHNPFIKQVCGGVGKSTNCEAVLDSAGATFMGINWSIWGFSYFSTFFLGQILFTNIPAYNSVWTSLSLLATPYIIYSIYYQWKIVKRWCPLCLAIQCILLLNATNSLVLLYSTSFTLQLNWYPIFNTSVLGLFFLLLAYYIIPIIKQARNSQQYEKRWKKLRFHPDVFQTVLRKGKKLTSIPSLGVIIGNPNAKHEIIKVCNPYCRPCSNAHPILEDLIKNNSDIKIRIIFKGYASEDDKTVIPAQHFLAIQEQHGAEVVHRALDDWYLNDEKDYDLFSSKYPMNGEVAKQKHHTTLMNEWCAEFKIRATPTLFINGYEYPNDYQIKELKNFF